jgi:hypothetical protein
MFDHKWYGSTIHCSADGGVLRALELDQRSSILFCELLVCVQARHRLFRWLLTIVCGLRKMPLISLKELRDAFVAQLLHIQSRSCGSLLSPEFNISNYLPIEQTSAGHSRSHCSLVGSETRLVEWEKESWTRHVRKIKR